MRSRMRLAGALAVPVALLGLVACSDSDDGFGRATDDSSSSPGTDGSDTSGNTGGDTGAGGTSGPECTAADFVVDGGFGVKPTVTLPDDCSPPSTLLVEDLVEGSGPAAQVGGTVEADYLLVTWSDGLVLDNSFDRGMTFPVTPLGEAQVIQGWNDGLVGMKQGTRRLLVVPPDLGYGAGGNGIAPNETLVFVVDAVSVS